MSHTENLFTELNDRDAWDLFLRGPPGAFLSRVAAGERRVTDESTMANEFQMAANLLRDAAIKSGTPWFYANPILYLYRHAIELHLKGIVRPSKPTHSLRKLNNALIKYVKTTYDFDISGGWLTDTISEFANIDPDSTRFRYAKNNQGQPNFAAEQEVDLNALKTRLEALFLALWQLKMAMPKSVDAQNSPAPESPPSPSNI
jgi:hypothetical protein